MNNDNPYCCAGASFNPPSCFPFCSGSSTSMTSQSCPATVYFTDSDYSSKVSQYVTSNGAGSASGGGSMATSTSSASSDGGSGGNSVSSESSDSSSSSEGAAAAMITSGPLVGALMVAGGLMLGV